MIIHLYHKIRFAILKKRIKRNPYIGKEDVDGSYNYKQGSYELTYCIVKVSKDKESVQWISERRRLNAYEMSVKEIKHNLSKFWHYQGWLVFLRLPILFLLITSILIFYFGFIETQKTKVERLKWIVASVVGASPQQIQYIGDGWLEISTQRKTEGDYIYEPVRYRVNPLRWFFSPEEAGFLTRWHGQLRSYITHPIVYNERGEVWIYKEGTWRHGKIGGKTIEWDVPQGTGIRAGKVDGHEIFPKEDRLRIKDK